MEVIIGKRRLTPDPTRAKGKGGEADIFDIGGGDVLKLFKPPDHPDYAGITHEQQGARFRISEHQTKLPAFPKELPARVIVLKELALDDQQQIVGYTMPFLTNVKPLWDYAQKSSRSGGITDTMVIKIFKDLYTTVRGLHDKNVIIGDFNDLNVLIKDTEAYLVDADSMQFGSFKSRMFTAAFVDPRLCDPSKTSLMLIKPHDAHSDWFAYLVMLMRCLLFVDPFGGVYKPSDATQRLPYDARPLRGISVFHAEVKYPRPARPLGELPDTLLQYFREVFEGKKRELPPLSLLERLQFGADDNLLTQVKPEVLPELLTLVVTGSVRAQRVFETPGHIMFATHQAGSLKWLSYHNGKYTREDGRVVVETGQDPQVRFRIAGDKTIIAKGNTALVFDKNGTRNAVTVETFGMLPLIEGTEHGLLYAADGTLRKESPLGLEYADSIGDLLPNQTLFWSGGALGFGFYRAGQLCRYFVFDPRRKGINDGVELPPLRGQLVDSTCIFGKDRVWFFASLRENGQTMNHCYVIDTKGILLAEAHAPADQGSWLGTIRGKCAIGDLLLAPTDDGIVQLRLHGSTIAIAKEFPDTARFVDSGSLLFPGNGGLKVVKGRSIWNLTIT